MSEPSLEKFEQLLAADPSSLLFVDWAKALIDGKDFSKAATVASRGLSYHPQSIEGHVLLGRSLLELSRPAEAMEAFDKAIAIEPENPYAFQWVSEVLLGKGLYRPALPLLKKAVALQPNNGKVRQWLAEAQKAVETRGEAMPPPSPSDPFDMVAKRVVASTSEGESTVVFNPNGPAAQEPDPFEVVASAKGKSAPVVEPEEMTQAFDTMAHRKEPENTVIPSFDALRERAPKPPHSGLLSNVPSANDFVTVASSNGTSSSQDSLLPDVPALRETHPGLKTGINVMTTQETEAVAREYEQELRRQMAEQAAAGSFLQRHGTKILLSVMAVLIGMAFGVAYLQTQSKNSGRDLAETLAEAKVAYAQDTASGYRKGLKALSLSLKMAPDNVESLLWSAYGWAVLYAEHGGLEEDKKNAVFALSQPGVRETAPGVALVISYHLADPKPRVRLKRQVIESKFDESEVEELAGRLLLADKKFDEALKRLSRSVELNPRNVRALLALGNYYLQFQDPENALKLLDGTAAQLSPRHAERVLGVAEARLMLRRQLDEALDEVKGLEPSDVPGLQMGRRQWVLGRLFSATGKHSEAIETLKEGARQFEGQAFEFQMALGRAAVAAGRMGQAQAAFEAARAKQPDNDEAREGLGRVLLARDREKDVLEWQGDSKSLHLLRGVAHAQLKDWKKARVELLKTEVQGKFPPEAVIYLAMADGFEGEGEKAIGLLEKVLAASKTVKPDVHLALGTLHWKRGQLPKAKEHLEWAAKEPTHYEGACSMGRLLLELNLPDLALTPLFLAVSRNDSHQEAHAALQQALDALGRYSEALEPSQQWAQAHPDSYAAQLAHARMLTLNGRLEEALNAVSLALKLKPTDVSAHRLKAMVHDALGAKTKAFESLQKANQLNPKDAETFCEIGHHFIRGFEKDAAQAAFAAAVREDEKSICGRVGAYWAKLPSVGPAAARELAEWVKAAPDGATRAFAQATRARALLANGALKEARAAADAAVKLTPFSGNAQWTLALVATKQKDATVAWEAWEKALQYEPVSGPIQLGFADAHARGRDSLRLAKVIAAYEAFLAIGGSENDVKRVEKELPQLKKRLE